MILHGVSQENVELLRRAWDAVNSGVDVMLPFFPEDCIWYPFPEWPDGPQARTGHDGIREIMASWAENFDEFSVALRDTRDLGDRVVALGEQTARIRGSGVPIRQPVGQLCSDFRDGTIGEVRFFLTWTEALEAAGLSE